MKDPQAGKAKAKRLWFPTMTTMLASSHLLHRVTTASLTAVFAASVLVSSRQAMQSKHCLHTLIIQAIQHLEGMRIMCNNGSVPRPTPHMASHALQAADPVCMHLALTQQALLHPIPYQNGSILNPCPDSRSNKAEAADTCSNHN